MMHKTVQLVLLRSAEHPSIATIHCSG